MRKFLLINFFGSIFEVKIDWINIFLEVVSNASFMGRFLL
jgi:hypothetical protein